MHNKAQDPQSGLWDSKAHPAYHHKHLFFTMAHPSTGGGFSTGYFVEPSQNQAVKLRPRKTSEFGLRGGKQGQSSGGGGGANIFGRRSVSRWTFTHDSTHQLRCVVDGSARLQAVEKQQKPPSGCLPTRAWLGCAVRKTPRG